MSTCPSVFDALVVGAGPAGLSAALALGRVLRSAVVFDTNVFRNSNASHMHTVPTWDHQNPVAYRQQSLTELRTRYNASIQFAEKGVVSIKTLDNKQFTVTDEDGMSWTGKKVILATGVKDILPNIDGYAHAWGRSIFHCLFCHGFEQRQSEKAGVMILDKSILPTETEIAMHFGHLAKQFANTITVYLDGNVELLEDPKIQKLKAQGFVINSKAIKKINHVSGSEIDTVTVELEDGSVDEMAFLIHRPKTILPNDFVEQLGLELTEQGDIKTKPPFYESSVEGVFAAGDCAVPLKQVVWAAATGVSAGSGVNFQLLGQDMKTERPILEVENKEPH